MSPLMTAAYAGHAEVVSLLLDAGASPEITAHDGASALYWAACNGHHEIVRLLLDAGANVNTRRGANGPTPLHMAISNGHDGIAITLIQAGTSLNARWLGRDVRELAHWRQRNLVVQYIDRGLRQ
jgi:ankyrin repeat protein